MVSNRSGSLRSDAPLVSGPTRSQAVTDRLRQEVLQGDHPPGTRLRQVEVAERLGVSTTPVREAFATLVQEGLVLRDSHRGVIVFQPSERELHEIYEIRRELEPLATRLATPRIADIHLDELDSIIHEMRGSQDAGQRQELNRLLHRRIYELSDRPRLVSMIEQLRDTASLYLRFLSRSSGAPSYRAEADDEHQRIVDALRRRDAEAASAEMRLHLSHSERSIETAIKAGP